VSNNPVRSEAFPERGQTAGLIFCTHYRKIHPCLYSQQNRHDEKESEADEYKNFNQNSQKQEASLLLFPVEFQRVMPQTKTWHAHCIKTMTKSN